MSLPATDVIGPQLGQYRPVTSSLSRDPLQDGHVYNVTVCAAMQILIQDRRLKKTNSRSIKSYLIGALSDPASFSGWAGVAGFYPYPRPKHKEKAYRWIVFAKQFRSITILVQNQENYKYQSVTTAKKLPSVGQSPDSGLKKT